MQRAAHTAWRQLGEETVVVNLRDRRIVGLAPVGGWIWSLLDGRTLEELEAELGALPGADEGAAAALGGFLAELEALGLVDRNTLAAGPCRPTQQPERYAVPQVRWSEPLEQAAASCGFISGQTPLCTQVPAI
jgi:hypothetical protein